MAAFYCQRFTELASDISTAIACESQTLYIAIFIYQTGLFELFNIYGIIVSRTGSYVTELGRSCGRTVSINGGQNDIIILNSCAFTAAVSVEFCVEFAIGSFLYFCAIGFGVDHRTGSTIHDIGNIFSIVRDISCVRSYLLISSIELTAIYGIFRIFT